VAGCGLEPVAAGPGSVRPGGVVVDQVQSRESGPGLDPVGGGGEGRHVRIVAWCARAHAVALVAAPGVVVRGVFGRDHRQVTFPDDQHPVSALGADRAHEAFGVGVHPRRLRRGGQHVDSDRGGHGVGSGGELRIPVPDQAGDPVTGLLALTGEVAGELGGPFAGGVRRDGEQVNTPGPGLDDERGGQALEREDAVNAEEVRASSVAAGERRKARQDSSRCAGGGTR
jgi:hypothetical protein